MSDLKDSKTEAVVKIISAQYQSQIKDLLVVGCGSGTEAAILAQQLGANVVGIDITDEFDPTASKYASLSVGDATALEFEDESFDFVYSYHALEHINDPKQALLEINRVLKAGGGFWVGTPNRLRALGYLGSKTANWQQKIQWNLNDWKARLTGKFRNELGAHAGFSSKELNQLLQAVFPDIQEVTDAYYCEVHHKYDKLLSILSASKLARFVCPSVYFMGTKL